ncbi:hypothetical protein [Spirillospora sp. CA-294931]|uniref:hypothetical protein n=1 Tax=Spirillospora sp. CA-294931 TaxID=3240042 RepID=UPI003D89D557
MTFLRIAPVIAACVATVGGCGTAAAWQLGVFTRDGRFEALDACTLLPPPSELARYVHNGRLEPIDSKPKSLFDLGGDTRSECKWSSNPSRWDNPFRTIRIHAETKVHHGRTTGVTEAREGLDKWRQARNAAPAKAGEEAFTHTDLMQIQVVFVRTDIHDIHVKFRVSNALIDVSARTHAKPGDRERALVADLARSVATRLTA